MTIVLSKAGCVQCTATERHLKTRGIEYEIRKVDEDPEALALSKSLGYLQAPVVIAPDGTHWSGFQPAAIDRIAA